MDAAFIPAGGSKRIVIQSQVKSTTIPGTIQRNMARTEDDAGHVSNVYEDTVVVGQLILTASLEDLPIGAAGPDRHLQLHVLEPERQ